MSDASTQEKPARSGLLKKILTATIVVLLIVAAGGGGAWYAMNQVAGNATGAAPAEGGEAPAPKKRSTADPVFLPLETFTVNLADKDQERYAQIGITLELEDSKYIQQFKTLMPVVRDRLLMVLAHKTAEQLLDRSGKEVLAEEIMREAVLPLGVELDDNGRVVSNGSIRINPVRQVLFSNIIIQ